MKGFWAVFIKEFAHIRRERSTLFFALLIPAVQLTIFGYAVNTTIDNVPYVVLNLDCRTDSRRLIEAFENSGSFKLRRAVDSYDQAQSALRSGDAKAALIIPPDFTDCVVRGEAATAQLLIDGSDAQIASSAMNNANLVIQNMALARARQAGERSQTVPSRDIYGRGSLPIELRPRLLYNPNLLDANFFVPGLVAIILQFVLSFLTAFSVAKERESGTLEQLFVTPVTAGGLLFGKLCPYAILALTELVIVLSLMIIIFGVPIIGSLLWLFIFSALFIMTALGMGVMISTFAATQLQALQLTFLVMLPSVLLSGFVFPRSEMPLLLYLLGAVLPATYFVDLLRGVIVRGADAIEMLPAASGLLICFVAIVAVSFARFRKTID